MLALALALHKAIVGLGLLVLLGWLVDYRLIVGCLFRARRARDMNRMMNR